MNIAIKCETKDHLSLDQITEFQGNLKNLSTQNYEKLKKQILDHGFSAPFFIWKDKNINYCLDGHQRLKTLKQMQKDGFTIPDLPVVFIQANDKKEAKKKLLAFASQFGEMTDEGLSDFAIENDLSFDFIMENFRFPEINMSSEIFADTNNTSKELDLDKFQNFDHQCPKCGFEWDEKGD